MIAVVENKGFVEAIFRHGTDADLYLKNHPQPENCKVVKLGFINFPLYIIENGRGVFSYFGTKEALAEYCYNLKVEEVSVGRSARFSIGGDGDKEIREEPTLTLYIIQTPFLYGKPNSDRMGCLNSIRIDWGMILDFKHSKDLADLCLDENGLEKTYYKKRPESADVTFVIRNVAERIHNLEDNDLKGLDRYYSDVWAFFETLSSTALNSIETIGACLETEIRNRSLDPSRFEKFEEEQS